jgi:hypothetical protein
VAVSGVAPAAVDFSPANFNAKAQRRRDAKVLADDHPFLRLGVFAPWRLIPSPAQSARGLAHSKTLRAVRWSSVSRQRFGVRWPSTAFSSRTKHARKFTRTASYMKSLVATAIMGLPSFLARFR